MATAEFSKFAGILSAALSQHHFSMMEHGSGWSMDLLEHGSGKGIEGLDKTSEWGHSPSPF